MSSKSISRSTRARGDLRKTSTQTDVSTRTMGRPSRRPPARPIVSHLGEVSVPEARAGQREDLPRAGPSDEVVQSAPDRPRVRALAAQPNRLFEQPLIKHKICAFHTHRLHRDADVVKPSR